MYIHFRSAAQFKKILLAKMGQNVSHFNTNIPKHSGIVVSGNVIDCAWGIISNQNYY